MPLMCGIYMVNSFRPFKDAQSYYIMLLMLFKYAEAILLIKIPGLSGHTDNMRTFPPLPHKIKSNISDCKERKCSWKDIR